MNFGGLSLSHHQIVGTWVLKEVRQKSEGIWKVSEGKGFIRYGADGHMAVVLYQSSHSDRIWTSYTGTYEILDGGKDLAHHPVYGFSPEGLGTKIRQFQCEDSVLRLRSCSPEVELVFAESLVH